MHVFHKENLMKKLKVLTSFTRLPIVDKASFCRNVVVKMTNNILFGAPDVSLAEATAALDAFDAAILAAKDGAHTAISIRNDCEKVVDAKFILLAKYVDRIANGDETAILSSGFNESHQPSTPTKEELTVNDGDFSGSIFTKSQLITHNGSFRWEIRLLGTTVWVVYVSIQSTFVITGLISGSTYEVRVAAVTKDGQQPFSQIVTKLVV